MANTNIEKIDFSEIVSQGLRPSDDEALFARDIDGRLIRMERATADDFDKQITVKIDGTTISVPKAVPTRDSQGNLLRDASDNPLPRYTTIYDAAAEAFVKTPGDVHPIPTLCHKEHLPPVGVCRVCVVEAAEVTRRGVQRKLVPACVQRITEGMEIHTVASQADPKAAERVRVAAGTVAELMIADHLPSSFNGNCPTVQEAGYGNELAALAERLDITKSRFSSSKAQRGKDLSSYMISVDHDQCIMCGRCVRGCNYVKENFVLGRSLKGYESRIAFDLDQPMAESSCVSCGECAVSCPTGALEFKPEFLEQQQQIVLRELKAEGNVSEIVPLEELVQLPLFSGIPFKFLQFNASSVLRRVLEPGDVLCREGEYGATAFIIVSGSFEIFLSGTRGAIKTKKAAGLSGLMGGLKTFVEKIGGVARLADIRGADLAENQRLIRTKEDVILGEMTCMNRYPRSATVVAIEPAEVLEIRRNVLYMLQRNEASRSVLERAYRQRALVGQLRKLPVIAALEEPAKTTAAKYLENKVDLVSVEPGQVIFRQGDAAQDFYMVKLGFVKVTQRYGENDRVLNYIGPGNFFGEIALLSQAGILSPEDLSIETGSRKTRRVGTRTATCTALDHVELVRISGEHFAGLLTEFPDVREAVLEIAKSLLERDRLARTKLHNAGNQDFLDQGLYLAQSLLVLDLERCTRCDECTKACADTHDGVTRLVREGLRFDKYLIASSCRSCMDPYCLVGCPVDAIHRNGDSLEIQIEDYCIGCGLCAGNCPYGNINMHGFPKLETDPTTGKDKPVFEMIEGRKLAVIQQRATTCDLCSSVDGKPSCVYACPHNAAFRLSGEELLAKISR